MNHPDIIRSFSLNNFFYLFKKDSLEISSKDVTWIVTENNGMVNWSVDNWFTNQNALSDFGCFKSSNSCRFDVLDDTIFYENIKQWIELKNSL
tara:strand:+ start:235 stop:513 length:279 start_codon:yes stop_codon:yes gene_type:complete